MLNKRLFSAILLITMALILTACGEKAAPASTTVAQTTEAVPASEETTKAEETTTEETTMEEETTTEETTTEEPTMSKDDLLNEAQETSSSAMSNAFVEGTSKDFCNIPIIVTLYVNSFGKDYAILAISKDTPQIGFDAYLPEEDLAAIKEGDLITIAAIATDIQDGEVMQPSGIPLLGPHYVMKTAYLIEVKEP